MEQTGESPFGPLLASATAVTVASSSSSWREKLGLQCGPCNIAGSPPKKEEVRAVAEGGLRDQIHWGARLLGISWERGGCMYPDTLVHARRSQLPWQVPSRPGHLLALPRAAELSHFSLQGRSE